MFSVFKRRTINPTTDMHAEHRALNMIANLLANGNSEPDTMADALDFASAVAYVALTGDNAAVDRITAEYLENGARDTIEVPPAPEKFRIHIPPTGLSAADRAKGFTLGPLIPGLADEWKRFRARILRK